MLAAWVASHAFGVGEVIDLVVLAVGVVAIGAAVFSGVDRLYDFAVGVYRGKSSRDFDVAAGGIRLISAAVVSSPKPRP